jgi:hypothetical protein
VTFDNLLLLVLELLALLKYAGQRHMPLCGSVAVHAHTLLPVTPGSDSVSTPMSCNLARVPCLSAACAGVKMRLVGMLQLMTTTPLQKSSCAVTLLLP